MNEHNVRGWAFLCCFLLIIFSLAAFAMVDYIRNPTAGATEIHISEIKKIECRLDRDWGRLNYPIKGFDCNITLK